MENKIYLAIEVNFKDNPWTVIYRTSNLVDLMYMFDNLTQENNPDYHFRPSIFLSGRYLPINF